MRLPALDGYALGACFYPAPSGEAPVQAAVVHCGAAIAAARYCRFAGLLAASGIPTLVYDYRGIGLSRPHALRGFRVSVEDWAEHDCGGAIAWLRERFPHAKIIGIAHSISALLVGGAPNAAVHDRLVFVGGHTGYYGDYHWRYRVPMAALWHVLMPVITRIVGYFPARRLGLGEDIPATIALQWASRRSPDLRAQAMGPDHARAQALLDRCAALERPALVISVSDDAFATRSGVERLLSCYPRLSPWSTSRTPRSRRGRAALAISGFSAAAPAPCCGRACWHNSGRAIRVSPRKPALLAQSHIG